MAKLDFNFDLNRPLPELEAQLAKATKVQANTWAKYQVFLYASLYATHTDKTHELAKVRTEARQVYRTSEKKMARLSTKLDWIKHHIEALEYAIGVTKGEIDPTPYNPHPEPQSWY